MTHDNHRRIEDAFQTYFYPGRSSDAAAGADVRVLAGRRERSGPPTIKRQQPLGCVSCQRAASVPDFDTRRRESAEATSDGETRSRLHRQSPRQHQQQQPTRSRSTTSSRSLYATGTCLCGFFKGRVPSVFLFVHSSPYQCRCWQRATLLQGVAAPSRERFCPVYCSLRYEQERVRSFRPPLLFLPSSPTNQEWKGFWDGLGRGLEQTCATSFKRRRRT